MRARAPGSPARSECLERRVGARHGAKRGSGMGTSGYTVSALDRTKSVDLLRSLGENGLDALIDEFKLPVSKERFVDRASLAFDYAFGESLKQHDERPIVLRLLARADQMKQSGIPSNHASSSHVGGNHPSKPRWRAKGSAIEGNYILNRIVTMVGVFGIVLVVGGITVVFLGAAGGNTEINIAGNEVKTTHAGVAAFALGAIVVLMTFRRIIKAVEHFGQKL